MQCHCYTLLTYTTYFCYRRGQGREGRAGQAVLNTEETSSPDALVKHAPQLKEDIMFLTLMIGNK
jgi:hypothetical protein